MVAVWATIGIVAVICLIGLILLIVRLSASHVSVPEARRMFEQQVEQLQSSFFLAAASTGKPRGLTWKSCEFGSELEMARDKKSGELLALLPLTIAFDAIPGSDMEGLPAVGNLRLATAVFVLRKRYWTTDGRAVFNMNPVETLRHFHNRYEPIAVNNPDAANRDG
jgi:hypothetical protein